MACTCGQAWHVGAMEIIFGGLMKRLAAYWIFLALISTAPGLSSALEAQGKRVVLHFFYGKECPHCRQIEPEIEALVKGKPGLELKKYEVWYNKENRATLIRMAKERGKNAQGVPTVIIGNDVYTGSDMARIRGLVAKNTRK